MDLPIGPDRSQALSLALDTSLPEPVSHAERLAAAVNADPFARAQANVLRMAYGAENVPSVLEAVHAGGPNALADLTARPERYGAFVESPKARQMPGMLAGTLPTMDGHGGMNDVLNSIPRIVEQRQSIERDLMSMEPTWGQLASPGEMVHEIHRGLEGVKRDENDFREPAGILSAYLRTERTFTENINGIPREDVGSSRINRYTYTQEYGG